jgi:hypothetical protein
LPLGGWYAADRHGTRKRPEPPVRGDVEIEEHRVLHDLDDLAEVRIDRPIGTVRKHTIGR